MSGPSNSSSLSKTSIFHLHVSFSFCPLDPRWLFTRNPQAIRQPFPNQPEAFFRWDHPLSQLFAPACHCREILRIDVWLPILPVVLVLKALWDSFLFKEKRRSRRSTEMSLLSLIIDQKDKIMYLSTFNVITTTYINDFFKF